MLLLFVEGWQLSVLRLVVPVEIVLLQPKVQLASLGHVERAATLRRLLPHKFSLLLNNFFDPSCGLKRAHEHNQRRDRPSDHVLDAFEPRPQRYLLDAGA